MNWQTLLVDPDAATRRYVRMVLEEFALVVSECASVPHALQLPLLNPNADLDPQHRMSLLVIDGHLGHADCLALMEHLSQLRHPATPAVQALVMGSNHLPAASSQALRDRGAQLLVKPISAHDLRAAVTQAIRKLDKSLEQPTEPADTRLQVDTPRAIATYFEGDAHLYGIYRTVCFQQFPEDLKQGEQACARGDLPTLRRTAHSLKSVMLTLGYEGLSRQAATVESLSLEGQSQAAKAGWLALAAALGELLRVEPPAP